MEQNIAQNVGETNQPFDASRLESIEKQVIDLKEKLDALSGAAPDNKISMIVFSGDLDKALDFYQQSLTIREELTYRSAMITNELYMGRALMKKDNNDAAEIVIPGKVVEAKFIGNLISYEVDIGVYQKIILKEHNTGQDLLKPGASMQIGWNICDSLLVE